MKFKTRIVVIACFFALCLYALITSLHLNPPSTKKSLKIPFDVRAPLIGEIKDLDKPGIRNLDILETEDDADFAETDYAHDSSNVSDLSESSDNDENLDEYDKDHTDDEHDLGHPQQTTTPELPSLPEKPKSSIAIITIYDNETQVPGPIGGRYLDILTMSLTTKKAYAERNGYDFHVDLHMWIDKDRPVAWSKLLAIRERLNEYKWVLWVDIDTLFMNFDIKLESLIDENYDFIVTKDGSGLNSGVMLFRQSQWAKDFLLECYQQSQFLIHKDIYEQRAVQHVITSRPEYISHVKYLPQKAMNSYTHHHTQHYAYQKGDFMLHMAGCRFLPNCKPYFYETYRSYFEMSKAANSF